eukprot:TRINITY_DN9873_c0_g1_i1.p1 TRINITY_DN9873_c0_g1~~TRINITY_DN9873_c0_g1_i1.p1  ORF type:complete len:469 (-),score=69.56 TRINITY_DN9873_c0_g1_i1:37-1443(-)
MSYLKPQNQSESRIIKEGTLQQKAFLAFLRPRHVILTSSEFLVFESKGDAEAKSRLDLVNAQVKTDPSQNHTFAVESGSEKVSLRAASPEERQTWIRAISDAIDAARNAHQQRITQQLQQNSNTNSRPNPLSMSERVITPTDPSSSARNPLSASTPGRRNTTTGGGSATRISHRPAPPVPETSLPMASSQSHLPLSHTHSSPPYQQSIPYQSPLPPTPQPQSPQQSQSQALSQSHSQLQAQQAQQTQSSQLQLKVQLQSQPGSVDPQSLHAHLDSMINNPHAAVYPEPYTIHAPIPPIDVQSALNASMITLVPEVRELFQPVQRWQPPVPESLKLKIERDSRADKYLQSYREEYPLLFADPTFVYPDQENVCQMLHQQSGGTTTGSKVGTSTMSTSDILAAASAGYPGAYHVAVVNSSNRQPPRQQPQRARAGTTTSVQYPSYYYAAQPVQYTAAPARQPSNYAFSRY